MLTLLDIAKLNQNDAMVGLIEENIAAVPAAAAIPWRTIKGTTFTTGVRTGLPATGFRGTNAGQAKAKSTFAKRTVETFVMSGPIAVDVAIADAYEDGSAALLSIEASGVTRSALINIEKQIFAGVTQDANGFPGLKAATPYGGVTALGDALTVNATGTTGCESVYLVKFGPQNVELVGGMNRAFGLDEWSKQLVPDDSDATKFFLGYVNALTSWVGLSVQNENAVRRIANVSAETGKGLTDKLLAQAAALFPVGYRPDAIFASRRAVSALQQSRTVTLMSTGAKVNAQTVAPWPTEFEGIPIYATDGISITDTAES